MVPSATKRRHLQPAPSIPSLPKGHGSEQRVFCPWWLWPLTFDLTFKVVRARDKIRLPCEFGANRFSRAQDIWVTNKKKTASARRKSHHTAPPSEAYITAPNSDCPPGLVANFFPRCDFSQVRFVYRLVGEPPVGQSSPKWQRTCYAPNPSHRCWDMMTFRCFQDGGRRHLEFL